MWNVIISIGAIAGVAGLAAVFLPAYVAGPVVGTLVFGGAAIAAGAAVVYGTMFGVICVFGWIANAILGGR